MYNVSAWIYIYTYRHVNFSITKRKLTILFHFAFRGNVLGLVLIIENFVTVSNKLTRAAATFESLEKFMKIVSRYLVVRTFN